MLSIKEAIPGNVVIYDKLGTFDNPDSNNNPLWGGTQGKVKGTILSVSSGTYPIMVRWENGKENVYSPEHLSLYKRNKAKISYLKRYKNKLLFTVAVLSVIILAIIKRNENEARR